MAQNIRGERIISSTTINVATIYSGGTNLSTIISNVSGGGGGSASVRNGNNIVTGGTAAAPTINLVASPSINGITVSGTAAFTGTVTSGGTNLYNIFTTVPAVRVYFIQESTQTVSGVPGERSIISNPSYGDTIQLAEKLMENQEQLRFKLNGVYSTAGLGNVADVTIRIRIDGQIVASVNVTQLEENIDSEYFSLNFNLISRSPDGAQGMIAGDATFLSTNTRTGLVTLPCVFAIDNDTSFFNLDPSSPHDLEVTFQLNSTDPANIFSSLFATLEVLKLN